MSIEIVQRARLNGPKTDVTLYSGQFGDRQAIRSTLIVHCSGVNEPRLTQIEFLHPQTGGVIDTWKGDLLVLKCTKNNRFCDVYELPTFDGLASKMLIQVRGLTGANAEYRLQLNVQVPVPVPGQLPAAAVVHPPRNISITKHLYKSATGNQINLNTCGARETNGFYMSMDWTLLAAADRVVVTKCVDCVNTVILDRCLADVLGLISACPRCMYIELPRPHMVKDLQIELHIANTEYVPNIDLIVPVSETVAF